MLNENENKIKVNLESKDTNKEISCYIGTNIKNILKKYDKSSEPLPYLGALVNNEIVSLTYPLEVDSNIRFLTLKDSCGWRIYRDSVAFLISKTVKECFPDLQLEIKHSLENGFYCSLTPLPQNLKIEDVLKLIEMYMKELVSKKLPIERKKLFLNNAISYFSELNQEDKTNLLHFQNPSKITVYKCEDFMDLAHSVLADNTKYLEHFRLVPYDSGFILQFPERKYPINFKKVRKLPHLFNIFKAYEEWSANIGIKTVGDLNEIIVRGNFKELIDIEEANQEKNIAEIADAIAKRENVKWALIAGPSSSGKTTFAHRLSTQIKVNGIIPKIISVDNYFKNRPQTPLDKDGNYDFENIDAIDLELLNKHLMFLDQGKEIETPDFNFKTGEREWHGKKIQLKENEIAIIEGIHSLNPLMTESLAAERKFKIYINALTPLNIDINHRISTTDNRLIRRIVRDHRTRGHRALKTFQMWPNVRSGENKWIFPFQKNADMAFNSALDYEFAILKPFIEPLLAEVKPWHDQYASAIRLSQLLASFSSATWNYYIPRRSLLREFIGNGILD